MIAGELAPGPEGGTILQTSGRGKCLAATLEPSPTVCNASSGAPLEVCDCDGQADCGYHRHCPKSMEFVVQETGDADGSVRIENDPFYT